MKPAHSFWSAVSLSCIAMGMTRGAIAQTIPDGTLPSNSTVTPNGNTLTIDGGTAAGGNLFHSFQDFNVPSNDIAHFNNALTIDNIITRVTGGNVSEIYGTIRANGTANLFLINPAGLVFGPNASLDIGGSFVGSTAQALQFEDGSLYSAVDVDAPPLLTVNVPVGLQFGAQPGAIQVEGGGHNVTLTPPTGELALDDRPLGLQVKPGHTLALVGGEIDLLGGRLKAPEGRIELGSVAGNSTVTLTPRAVGWQLEYDEVQGFQDIDLSNGALLDTTGEGAGAVQVRGRSLSFSEGSTILALTLGAKPSDNVLLQTTESIEAIGTTDAEFPSGVIVRVQPDATGKSGVVDIQTEQLTFKDGAIVSVSTRGPGTAGNLNVDATSIELRGNSPRGFRSGFLAGTSPNSSGAGGNIRIEADRLAVFDGARISGDTAGMGDAGDVAIIAKDIELQGTSIPGNRSSGIFARVLSGSSGEGGNITIYTQRLTVSDSARISTFTLGSGSAGLFTLRATESVTLENKSVFRANVLMDATGNGGNIEIETSQLLLEGESEIAAISLGQGNAGHLNITTTDLQLRNGSEITAQAGNNSDGGNITLATDTLLLFEESRINANAFEGRGGNVQITTQGIFIDPNSSITASSQLGIDGRIILNTPDVDPGSEVLVGSVTPIDINALIDRNPCRYGQESQFTIPGRGGLPQPPREWLRGEEGFVEPVKLDRPDDRTTRDAIPQPQPTRLVEAQGWILSDNGEVILTANPPKVTPQGKSSVAPNLTCQYLEGH